MCWEYWSDRAALKIPPGGPSDGGLLLKHVATYCPTPTITGNALLSISDDRVITEVIDQRQETRRKFTLIESSSGERCARILKKQTNKQPKGVSALQVCDGGAVTYLLRSRAPPAPCDGLPAAAPAAAAPRGSAHQLSALRRDREGSSAETRAALPAARFKIKSPRSR